jgi:hypothetical protein
LIDDFFSESIEDSKTFEENTKGDDMIYESDNEDENELSEVVCETFFKRDQADFHEPLKSKEPDWTHNQTTMFLNKYCENTNIPTVANKMADMIVDYEISQAISIENEDDFEIDDEIITEDEFLRNIDLELDKEESCEYQENTDDDLINRPCSEPDECDIEEQLQDIADTHENPTEELFSNLDVIFNPSEDQCQLLANKASDQAKEIMSKMEKNCVAPGEQGSFNNWGDDV